MRSERYRRERVNEKNREIEGMIGEREEMVGKILEGEGEREYMSE